MSVRSWPVFMAFALIAACIGARTVVVATKPMINIEIESLVIAERLFERDGLGQAGGQVKPPGYPALLALLATASPGLSAALKCRHGARQACAKEGFTAVFALQAVLAVAMMGLIYGLATHLSGSQMIGLLTLGLAFLMMQPGEQAGFIKADTLVTFLTIATVTLTVRAASTGQFWAIVASGAAGGLALAVEPLLATLVLTAACAVGIVRWSTGRLSACAASLALIGTAVGVAATVVALATRLGYDLEALGHHLARHLAERTAFTDLRPSEAVMATFLHIPIAGNLLAHGLPAEQLRRLGLQGLYSPGSLAYIGVMDMLPAALARSGSSWAAAGDLAAGAGRNAAGYLLSMPHILLRGSLGGVGLLGLWGFCHVWRAGRYLHVDGRLGGYATVVAVAAAGLATNALFSANAPFANPLLPILFAFALASVARSM